MSEIGEKADIVSVVGKIVAAYVSNNPVPISELSNLINDVHSTLKNTVTENKEADAEPLRPAVLIKKSVTPEYIICLEDGKKFKTLKRHLSTHYNMSPEQYREKWGLAADYPMVAPNYAQARSRLAKNMGLGQKKAGRPRN